jgi:hypothetical protein
MQHPIGDDGPQLEPEGIVEADPVDVADQRQAVDSQFEPVEPDPDDPPSLPLEAEPADVAEQRLEVPLLDEDDG